MTETPDEWLEDLFEFETCGECGGDAQDHEVYRPRHGNLLRPLPASGRARDR